MKSVSFRVNEWPQEMLLKKESGTMNKEVHQRTSGWREQELRLHVTATLEYKTNYKMFKKTWEKLKSLKKILMELSGDI